MDDFIDTVIEQPVDTKHSDTLNSKISHLRKTRFLQYASDALVQRLAETMKTVEAPAGSQIVEKGDQGDTMYFVVDGAVRVHDGNINITNLGQGATFGEIAALSPQHRTASITANENSLLYSVDQETLYRVLAEQPEAARSIIQGLCDHESTLVKDVIDRSVKVKVLEREMEIGQRIQQGFLPEKTLKIDGWDIESYFKAAREVAGDFYDFFEIKTLGRVAIIIGDVCDKGVGAALFMSLFRSLIRSSALSFDYTNQANKDADKQSPTSDAEVLTHAIRLVNQYVATTHAKDSMFATIFFGLIDPLTGELSYINAGHEAPYIVATDASITQLDITGPVVGLFEQAQYGVKNAKIGKGEMLLSFTDGISEAKNAESEEFGEQRITETVTPIGPNAKEAVSTLISAVNGFVGSAKQFDDITVLAVGRHTDGHN